MRGNLRSTALAAFLFAFAGGAALAQHEGHDHDKHDPEKAEGRLPRCPVMGEAVDFSVSTDTDDGPVYFCCEMCVKRFEKDADKYADKVAAQRKALAELPKVQVVCPFSGQAVNPAASFEDQGEKVYFCCTDCRDKFAKDPAQYRSKLAKAYTYQTRCPVSDGKIDPKSSTELANGKRIYFCCGDCEGMLRKDPAKFIKKLEQQGTLVTEEDITAKKDDAKPGAKEKP